MKKYILVLIVFAFISNCQNQNSNNLDKPLLLYYENKIPETIKILEQMIAEDDNNIEQIVWLAQSYMRLGDKDSAEKYAKIALSAEPCNNFAHLVYANSILPDYRDEVI